MDDLRRQSDVQIGMLRQEISDFRLQYSKDTAQINLEMENITKSIKDHDEFIRDLKPLYNKGMMAWGAFIIGSVGVGVHWLWKHLMWGP